MRVTYYQVGKRKWTKRVWGQQCDHKIMLTMCQGLKGHSGDHWCYRPNGYYHYSVNRSDLDEPLKPHDIAGGTTPPGHKDYIHPKDKQDEYYITFHEDSDVTDPELIEKLENDEFVGEDVCIDRPVSPEKAKEIMGELDD
tara:strand:+ start:4228 stop:4647 length:420 start_codon:yes stop_codon:yes gene_type:complete